MEDGMLGDLVAESRSYRRFYQDVTVERDTLLELVGLARLSPSAGNHQPLRFLLSHDSRDNDAVFPHLRWAGYLKNWAGPVDGERPTAYVVILGDREIRKSFGCDHGIAAQSIMLGATEMGLGGCIIGSVDRGALREALSISSRFEILLVLALGKPKESVVVEEVGSDGDIRYWRDSTGLHHVPKRSLNELVLCRD